MDYRTDQTTYSATTSPMEPQAGIRFSADYLRTIPGILKIAEIVLSIIVMICTMVEPWGGGRGWVQFVAIEALIITLVYLFIHLFNIYEVLQTRTAWWLLILFIYYAVETVFYLIAAIVAAANGRYSSAAAAAFFSFAALGVFAYDTFLQYKMWRSPDARSGSGPMTVTQHTTTTTSTTTMMSNRPETCGIPDNTMAQQPQQGPPPYSKY